MMKLRIIFIYLTCVVCLTLTARAMEEDPGMDDEARALLREIAAMPDANKKVRWIEPVRPDPLPPTKGMSIPDPPWGWERMNGHKTTLTGKGIVVAVLDTGVDVNHPALKHCIKDSFNAFDRSKSVTDDSGHGTHVAGIIAAKRTVNAAGLAPGIELLAIKVLDKDGGTLASVASGIVWAVNQKARIINLSLGLSEHSIAVEKAIEYAEKHGCLVVCAAGNDKAARPAFPARLDKAIAVSACDMFDKLTPVSNYGDGIDFIAPGARIRSTTINSGYAELSGTSMAAPHVTAALALAMEHNQNLKTKKEAVEYLKKACVSLKLSAEKEGNGLILADRIGDKTP